MYHVIWDRETSGILLSSSPPGDESLAAKDTELRPVFFEELDLLGFNHWSYPRSQAPLLWAVGREYYYRGELVAKAAGGSFYEKPTIEYVTENLQLGPVDLAEMAHRNAGLVDALAQRAIEFIRREYEQRKNNIDVVSVAFSGGKDSVVVLDLVQRALPPDAFVVVFGDTTMELSATYEAVAEAERHWPQLTFLTARSHLPAVETWKLFGPPSRIHRWCCSVHKSAPSLLTLRALSGKIKLQALVYDGIRHAESQRRSTYSATTVGGKHLVQINASPIITWNAAEVFAYTFSRSKSNTESILPMNNGYRYGLTRVGCAVCPFASKWGECITGNAYAQSIAPLFNELTSYANRDIQPGKALQEYIELGQWKMRSGGRAVKGGGNHVDIAERELATTFIIHNPLESWSEWAKTIGAITLTGSGEGAITNDRGQFRFHISVEHNNIEVQVSGIPANDRDTTRDFRAIAFKTAYCVHCRSCEMECPSGALSTNGSVSINLDKCMHCRSCLTFVDKGCWRARSISVSLKGAGMKGINAYQTFGMSKAWLGEYLGDPPLWWRHNSLGPRQFEAMKVWLDHANILDRATTDLTPFGKQVRTIGLTNLIAWGAIWTKLARKSALVRWYATQVPFGASYSQNDLINLLGEGISPRTALNGLRSLEKLLEDTPLGTELGLGVINRNGKVFGSISKIGSHNVPQIIVLFALFDFAEHVGKYSFSLNEIIEASKVGSISLFGLTREELVAELRGLSSQYDRILRVEFALGLENIYLESSITSSEVLGLPHA